MGNDRGEPISWPLRLSDLNALDLLLVYYSEVKKHRSTNDNSWITSWVYVKLQTELVTKQYTVNKKTRILSDSYLCFSIFTHFICDLFWSKAFLYGTTFF